MGRPAAARVALWMLALLGPAGALLAPYACPSRSSLPLVSRRLVSPIVLTTVAGLRADQLGHLGAPGDPTPGLDRIARQAASFTRAWANGSDAEVALASLLTGRCPEHHGLTGPGDGLAAGVPTLADRLQELGYTTLAVVARPGLARRGFQRGFQRFDVLPNASARTVLDAGWRALDAAGNGNVFLWLDLADQRAPGAGAALRELDAGLLAFRDRLAADGRLELLTWCIAGTPAPGPASAQGEELGDAALRVPLLLRLPAQRQRGRVLPFLAQGMDLAPTLLDLAVHQTLEGAEGASLRPALFQARPVHAYVSALGRPGQGAGGAAVAFRSTGSWLLLQGGERRLLDLPPRPRPAWRPSDAELLARFGTASPRTCAAADRPKPTLPDGDG